MITAIFFSLYFACCISALRISLPSSRVLPVFHNVLPLHVSELTKLVHNRPECSISLRHPEAVSSIREISSALSTAGSACKVGASTVDTVEQLQECFEAGAHFISTKDTKMARFVACLALRLPVFSGVQSVEQARDALKWGASALKVFPATDIPPKQVEDMLKELHLTRAPPEEPLRVFVSGGVTVESIGPYLAAGATDIMLGLDMNVLTMSEIQERLCLYDSEVRQYGS